jgi:hypothetical protein
VSWQERRLLNVLELQRWSNLVSSRRNASAHRPNGELGNRTSSAPETTSTKPNERNRNQNKKQQNQGTRAISRRS